MVRQSCYVVAGGGLERRAIKTRRATRDLLEITAGLHEGERVLSRSLDVDKLAIGGTTHHSAREIAEEPISVAAHV